MSNHDETPKTFHAFDPFAGISGSMGGMEEDFFAFGPMGGTNFPTTPELELLMDRFKTNPSDGRDWNKYIFQLTDGPAQEECLAQFLKAHSIVDSPQSEPEGS